MIPKVSPLKELEGSDYGLLRMNMSAFALTAWRKPLKRGQMSHLVLVHPNTSPERYLFASSTGVG
jgi:hypothetical protein